MSWSRWSTGSTNTTAGSATSSTNTMAGSASTSSRHGGRSASTTAASAMRGPWRGSSLAKDPASINQNAFCNEPEFFNIGDTEFFAIMTADGRSSCGRSSAGGRSSCRSTPCIADIFDIGDTVAIMTADGRSSSGGRASWRGSGRNITSGMIAADGDVFDQGRDVEEGPVLGDGDDQIHKAWVERDDKESKSSRPRGCIIIIIMVLLLGTGVSIAIMAMGSSSSSQEPAAPRTRSIHDERGGKADRPSGKPPGGPAGGPPGGPAGGPPPAGPSPPPAPILPQPDHSQGGDPSHTRTQPDHGGPPQPSPAAAQFWREHPFPRLEGKTEDSGSEGETLFTPTNYYLFRFRVNNLGKEAVQKMQDSELVEKILTETLKGLPEKSKPRGELLALQGEERPGALYFGDGEDHFGLQGDESGHNLVSFALIEKAEEKKRQQILTVLDEKLMSGSDMSASVRWLRKDIVKTKLALGGADGDAADHHESTGTQRCFPNEKEYTDWRTRVSTLGVEASEKGVSQEDIVAKILIDGVFSGALQGKLLSESSWTLDKLLTRFDSECTTTTMTTTKPPPPPKKVCRLPPLPENMEFNWGFGDNSNVHWSGSCVNPNPTGPLDGIFWPWTGSIRAKG